MADTLTHEKRELLESTAPRRLGKAPPQQAPALRIHMAAGRRRCHLLRGRQWTGAPTVESSDLHGPPSSEFQNAPGIFDSLDGHDVQQTAIDSTLS
jgi:hypothetical protein